MKEHLALILFRINKAPISSWWHYLSPLRWFEGICQLLMMIVENATVGDLMIGGNAHTFCLPGTLVHLFWWFCLSRPVYFRSTLSFLSFVTEHSLMDLESQPTHSTPPKPIHRNVWWLILSRQLSQLGWFTAWIWPPVPSHITKTEFGKI